MITNEAIERAFFIANLRLNNEINNALYEYYLPELEREENIRKFTLRRNQVGDNPIGEVNNGIR